MKRKEIEEIKEYYEHLKRELPVLRDKPIKRTLKHEYVIVLEKLIHALENGGIEDEPVLCIQCGVPLTLANYEDWNGNICNDCRKPEENDEPVLLPCPFCDAGTSALGFEYVERFNQGYYICQKTEGGCGANTGYTEYSINGGYKECKQRAADKWNTRATAPKVNIRVSEIA